MADIPFPILGTTIPPMFGRADIMKRLWSELTKVTPDHLSIVGPRFSGKTVIMKGLEERMRQDGSPYDTVIFWDLGHQTPDSNEAFWKALCRKLGEGLKASGNDYGYHLRDVETDEYDELQEVMDVLYGDGFKILMLWDGFDKPLNAGRLSRNLWDQLRELASNPSLRLVTATRRPVHELIRSDESGSSDFWNIFGMNPVQVGIFNENDRDAIMARISGFRLKNGAKKELENWTAGYPPLYLALLNRIIAMDATGEIDNEMVNDAAGVTLEGVRSILQYLWNDCPEMAKDLYRHIVEHGEISDLGIGKPDRAHLLAKGFIKVSGGRIAKGCRLLEQHIKSLGDDSGSMMRLFGPWEAYCGNIRSLLELRLNQLTSLDANLRRYIQRSIEDIPDHPEVCLSNMRGIVDRVLDLIWDAELGSGKTIPGEWFKEWQYGENGPENHWNNQFPVKRGHQLRLLQLMTGTLNSSAKASRVSKNTWALANAAHGFGDFGQHLDRVKIDVGVAVAAVSVCLELAACLDREVG